VPRAIPASSSACGVAGLRQDVLAVEEQTRVHVPGHAVGLAVDHVGRPDPGEESASGVTSFERASQGPSGSSERSASNSAIQVLPSCATSGVARPTCEVSSFSCAAVHGICCSSTLDSGVLALEVAHQLGDHLALAAHGPEANGGRGGWLGPAGYREQHEARDGGGRLPAAPRVPRSRPSRPETPLMGVAGARSSQPPRNAARRSPRTRCGFLRITFQTSSLRQFSIIARIGP
jgi:hypothetical protein